MTRLAPTTLTAGGFFVTTVLGCTSDAGDPKESGDDNTETTGSSTGSGGRDGRGGAATGGDGSGGMASGSGGFVPLGESGGADGGGGAPASGAGGTANSSGGAGGAAGGASGTASICDTAAEDESAHLSCPEGQRIESVVFASYGTPTGECGSFMEGACHHATSVSDVEELCVGRTSCTIAATNAAFSDPCNSTVKSLAVEVTCVPGEATVEPEPYKGIANSPATEISELGASWCYNWTEQPMASDCGDPLFVPMIWGGGNVANRLASIGAAGYDTVLGFNEPNKVDQANMSVADAIAQWPELTSDPDIRVGSPAVSDDGRAWLEDFMDQVAANDLRVDFIAMHWYGWNEGSCTASNLQGAINWASQWGLPVWITEFGCMGSSNTSEQVLLSFFNETVTMLENHPQVERYAWYPWNTYNHLYLPDAMEVRQRTPLGDAFLSAPAYR